MGGLGSGRYEYATTPTVEDCRALDVNEFTDAVEHPGTSGTILWGPEDDPSASIGVHLLPQSDDAEKATALRLEYRITDGITGEETAHDYRVALEYTECNFGGERPWFRCPGIVDGENCGRRTAKLYRPPQSDVFLCRHCYDLGYTSSRTSGDDLKQAELRYRRAFGRADTKDRRPHPNSTEQPHFPERPAGMHQDTYEELLKDVRAVRREWEDAIRQREQELIRGLRNV